MHSFIGQCSATLMIPDLFPGVALDFLFVPALVDGVEHALHETSALPDNLRVSEAALSAIGGALMVELDLTAKDLVCYEMDGGAEVIVFRPAVRDVVLQAKNVTLLNGAVLNA